MVKSNPKIALLRASKWNAEDHLGSKHKRHGEFPLAFIF
jgi:hypothetical protein